MRKTYGKTWWGKEWLNALNSIDFSNRLPRGRTYANKGMAYDIRIVGNEITAKVRGSRSTPYQIDFTIPLLSANAKAKIIDIVTGNPLFLSKLLNRELPKELNQACDELGINLLPKTWGDISGECSCPDWAVPCKHMAAVLYLMANELDKNPFLIFQLHGFDLFKGLEAIGYTALGRGEVAVKSVDSLWEKRESRPVEKVDTKQVIGELDFSGIADMSGALLKLLSENPVFFPQGDFKKDFERAYRSISKAVSKVHKQQAIKHEGTPLMHSVEDIVLFLNATGDFEETILNDAKGNVLHKYSSLTELMQWLDDIPLGQIDQYGQSLIGLYFAYRFAVKLVQESCMVPQLLSIDKERYRIRWLAATFNDSVKKVFTELEQLLPDNILNYKVQDAAFSPATSDGLQALLSVFMSHLVAQHHTAAPNDDAVARLFFKGSMERFESFGTQEYPVAIHLWLSRFFMGQKNHVPVLKIDDFENSFQVTMAIENKVDPMSPLLPLEDFFEKEAFKSIRLEMLQDMAMLTEYFPEIGQLVASKGAEKLFFDSNSFTEVLFKIIPTIRLLGVRVLLPKELRKLLRPQLSMTLRSSGGSVVSGHKGMINMQQMLAFDWQVAIGDQQLSPKEFLQLLKRYSGIVKINDQYAYFDEKEVKKLIDKMHNPPNLGAGELLQVALTENYQGAKVQLDETVKKMIESFRKAKSIEPPNGLKATLRPYQQKGYEWLYKNTKLGFGSIIADDMGLGKTLQIITLLLRLKEEGALVEKKALVVVPTTLLTNWGKEIFRFAPELGTVVYHGSKRSLDACFNADLVLTTYGVMRSDSTKLRKHSWFVTVIDEAQNIKNPTTAQTKAIKRIESPIKIAMSGTPVENRLTEYWSIFDFANKDYLDTMPNFKKNYAKPIELERDQARLEQFHKVTAPFILRRLKTDKSIIQDLPEKIEKDQFCELTSEQAAIYQNVVDTTLKEIEQSEGIARRGMVLKLITALKQICNHPTQFLKKGKTLPEQSGKTVLLFQLVKTILENNEKTLIFTQYQEMGKLLVKMLQKAFGFEVPFLHGGVSRKGRDEMVEGFQKNRSTKLLILSLKAGGTGLNLTAASNVIHYDLWWNPAVEAQATDRAYRIGQTKNVMVHRFITENTFEEKINLLLRNKRELANLTVASGEKWIGDFSNEELRNLVRLGQNA